MDWVPLAGGRADLSQQVVELGDRRLRLTTKERDLLAYLAGNPGRTVTREELVVHVWKNPARSSDEPVYSTVKRLRAKIDRGEHQHIVSVHGDGYRWAPPKVDGARGPAGAVAVSSSPRAAPSTERDAGSAPTPRSRFIGRGAELRAVAAAFDAGARLVTLVGPGGVGKTRCALELGASRSHVFCDLSSATSEGTAVAAVAAALGVPLDGAEPADWVRGVGRVIAAVPDRLLVLDNAEQIVDALAAMVRVWMEGRPTLLATSREPLRVQGERVIQVTPLDAADALALFTDRVAEAGGSPADPETSALIVERVDRLPLAIELAAAQAPQLGERALLDGLDAQLEMLVAGGRDAPARHATLRAAVEWSWTVLAERERDVLGQLAVFAGSFTAEAARAVVQGDDALAVVASLARKCQLRREGERFVLYAAVRELARERARAPEARHAAHHARVAEAAAELLDGPRHVEGADVLAAELDELRVAWRRTLDRDPPLAARLALVIDRAHGLLAEKAWSRREGLARSRQGLGDRDLVCALLLAEGRIDGAPMALLDEALAMATDRRVVAEIRLARGERMAPTGLLAAKEELERALELAVEEGAERLRGRASAALGELFWAHGLVADASARLRAALAVHVEVGDRRAIARTSALLAHVERVETGGGAARALLEQAEAAATELGDPVVRARVLLDLGQHLTRMGDQSGAAEALAEAAALYEEVGFARDRAFLHLHVAETLVGIGDDERALAEAAFGLEALRPDDVGRSTFHEAIGCIHMLAGRLDEAARWLDDGLAMARDNGAARSECTLLGKRGLLRLVRGSFEDAWSDFDTAVQKNEARGSTAIAGASLGDRAMAAFALGRREEGQRDLERARELLHDPSEDRVPGKMLALCAPIGTAFGVARRGTAPADAQAAVRTAAARYLGGAPSQERTVVLRLLEWLVDRAAASGP